MLMKNNTIAHISHFVQGKLIEDNIDKSGYTIVGKTPNLSNDEIQYIQKYTAAGQVRQWDNFQPSYNLTKKLDTGYRVFSYTFKSLDREKSRGHFPMQHCILLPKEFNSNIKLRTIVDQIDSKNINRSYHYHVKLDYLQLKNIISNDTNFVVWDNFINYTSSLLRIIDSLFLSSSIIVMINAEPKYKLSIMEAINALIPPILQQNLSFHTAVYGGVSQIQSHIKFKEPGPIDKQHFPVKWILDSESSSFSLGELRTEYAAQLFDLIKNKRVPIYQIASYCNKISDKNGDFDAKSSSYFATTLRNIVQKPIILKKVRENDSSVRLDDVIELIKEQKITLRKNEYDELWVYLINRSIREQRFNKLKHILAENISDIPERLWDDILLNLKTIPDYAKILNFFQSISSINHRIVLSNRKTLIENWITLLIDKNEIEQLTFFVENNELTKHIHNDQINDILSSLLAVHSDTEYYFYIAIDRMYKSAAPIDFLENVFAKDKLQYLGERYPTTCQIIKSSKPSKLSSSNTDVSLKTLLNELSSVERIIKLGILSIKTKQEWFIKPVFLELLLTANKAYKRDFIDIIKPRIKETADGIKPKNAGALAALLLAIEHGESIDIESLVIKHLKSSGFEEYLEGFSQISDKLNCPRGIYNQLAEMMSNNILEIQQIRLLVTVLEKTNDVNAQTYIFEKATQIYALNAQKIDFPSSFRDTLIDLLPKYGKTNKICSRNIATGIFDSVYNLEPEGIKSGFELLLKSSISAKDITDFLEYFLSLKKYSDKNIAETWYTLLFSQHKENFDVNYQTIQFILAKLTKNRNIQHLSDSKIKKMKKLLEGSKNHHLYQYINKLDEEILTRIQNTPPDEIINYLTNGKSAGVNKTNTLKKLDGLSKSWKPSNHFEIMQILSKLQKEGYSELAKTIRSKLASGDIDVRDDIILLKIFSFEMNELREQARVVSDLASELCKNQLDIDINDALNWANEVDNAQKYFSKRSRIYRELNNLKKKLRPHLIKRYINQKDID